jgi:hypothetical protein
LLQVGLDIGPSASVRYQQRFRQTNSTEQKFLISSSNKTKLQHWADDYEISHLQQYLNVLPQCLAQGKIPSPLCGFRSFSPKLLR